MADTLSHATQGGLLLLGPFIAHIRKRTVLWILAFTGGFFGALPDLIGAWGNYVEHDHWALYRSAHFGAIREILQYVPMYWLHLYVDSLMHGEGRRWWKGNERLWLEIAFWFLNFALIWWYVRIWEKNHPIARK
ncbi:MAG: hypothetical protein WB699_18675 [Bacteroidota bacterium]